VQTHGGLTPNRSPDISAEITVIITRHNYAHFLQDCLDSIAQSTLQPTHVIVIDDASDTPLQPSAFEISNLKSQIDWQRVEYRSQHLSRQHGFDQCVTKFVLWMDADDNRAFQCAFGEWMLFV
jgi:glycosyltransferase involved in cell wall biosynthesis